jgi:hypothetical protein
MRAKMEIAKTPCADKLLDDARLIGPEMKKHSESRRREFREP